MVAIDWVAWKEIGMAVDYGSNVDTTFKALPTATGMAVLDGALRSGRTRVFAGEAHYDGELVHLLKAYDVALAPEIETKIDAAVAAAAERLARAADQIRQSVESLSVTLTGRPDETYSATEVTVARCWAQAFGYDVIDVDADFFDLGGDSIMAMSVAASISTCLGQPFDVADLLTERTVAAAARHIGSTGGFADFPDDMAFADELSFADLETSQEEGAGSAGDRVVVA
jgi:acyl carrier protein